MSSQEKNAPEQAAIQLVKPDLAIQLLLMQIRDLIAEQAENTREIAQRAQRNAEIDAELAMRRGCFNDHPITLRDGQRAITFSAKPPDIEPAPGPAEPTQPLEPTPPPEAIPMPQEDLATTSAA